MPQLGSMSHIYSGKLAKMKHKKADTKRAVRQFWENNPLSVAAIPFQPGSTEFFAAHTGLRKAETTSEVELWAYEPDTVQGKRLLDIGCGNGYVTCLYAEAGADVVAVDITDRAVELTRARLALNGLDAEVKQADAETLPFEDESFDVVVSFGVLHHTPDTEQAIEEARRLLKPGGRLLLMLYHRDSFAYRFLFRAKRWLQPTWRGKTADEQVNAVDGPDNPLGKVYSKPQVRELLKSFSEVEFRAASIFFRWAILIPSPIRRQVEKRWGWHLFIKANKPHPHR